jgi:glutathione S-transferase
MQPPFRLFGAELSPYSVKVRSYLRYKGIAHEWIQRSAARQEEFARYAKLPLIPVLVGADDQAMQDSTPIVEALEAAFPDSALQPQDSGLAFLSALLEDYADEWLNKAMFHYRWTYPADQESAARRIVAMMFDGGEPPAGLEESVRSRMAGRLHHVGSSPETLPIIEASFERAARLLERVLSNRAYLFGGRPCLADFGLAGQFAQLLSDPTPGAFLKANAPNLVRWVDRMENPDAQGEFITFAHAADDFSEFLRAEAAGVYLPWMAANAEAVAEDGLVRADIEGRVFTQKPQRYAAKALAELQRKFQQASANDALLALMSSTGCSRWLDVEPDEEAAALDDSEEG